VTGVAAALFLARKGCSVALVEQGTIASGASGRNAGFLLAGIAHSYAQAIQGHGRERARELWKLSMDNHELLRDLIQSEAIDCQYARRGSYLLALSDQELRAHDRSVRALGEDGIPATFLDGPEAARLFPGSGVRGGSFHPRDGELHPVRFVRGLSQAAERSGARLFEGSRVLRIDQAPSSVTLHTTGGRLGATTLLFSTNAYTPLLHPFFDGAIVGMRGQMFATEPGPPGLIPAPVYADFGFEYFRQLPDGRILAGGGRRASLDTELTYQDQPTPKVQRAIESFLHSCFPAARGLRITHRWAGIMGFSCDELPNIGAVPGSVNLYVAAGYHGHGLGFSLIAARAVSEMIVEGRTSVPTAGFSPRRHLSE
jgi:glycine/D-amino acid oxidase-like deaminating enzyme